MNYLQKKNKDEFPVFLSDFESFDTNPNAEYFEFFSPQVTQSTGLNKSTLAFLKRTESRKHITNYWWQKIFSIEAKRQYNKELQIKSFLSFNQSTYNEAFNFFINEIGTMLPNNLSIKITASDSIYFKFELQDSYIIRLEVFLDDQDVFSEQIDNSSLIIEKENIQEYGCFCSPNEILKKLKNYFPSDYNNESSKYHNESSTIEEKEYSLTI